MSVITRLVQGKKNPNRVNLYLDGEFSFALSIDEVAKHNLVKGLSLSEAQIAELKDNDETEYVYAKLLNFLSFRPRSVKEVRDRLYKYEVKDKIKQDLLIERLQTKGYLDDLKFAQWFIDSRNIHRPRSVRMLSAELKSKGLSAESIKSVESKVVDERTTITNLLDKKLGLHHRLELPEKQKIISYLSRQGFAWDKIKEVVKTWESE
jgi:regulatory protein